MSDAPINRGLIRKALAAGLAAALPGASPLLTSLSVYDYMRSGFEGKSPVLRVVTAGSLRPEAYANGIRSQFYYSVQFFVIYYQDGDPSVQAQAEDILDELEIQAFTWIADNQQTDLWTELRFDQRSRSTVVKLGPHQYIMEDIPVVARVYG